MFLMKTFNKHEARHPVRTDSLRSKGCNVSRIGGSMIFSPVNDFEWNTNIGTPAGEKDMRICGYADARVEKMVRKWMCRCADLPM